MERNRKMFEEWDERIKNELEERLFRQWDTVAYEVRNCVRGYNTGATNSDELAGYLKSMSENLQEIIGWLEHFSDEN
jgi:hypothetical protein